MYRGKGKGHPRTGLEGPERQYRRSCTLPLDGVGGQCHATAVLPLGKRPSTHTGG
jgi:hypothetical protein